MKKTKLTELLSSFSNTEIKKLKTFLNSPYFNTKPQIIRLFESISMYHPDYENEKLTEEKVFKLSFPGKDFSYTIFKNNISDLYELVKHFLTIEYISGDRLLMKNNLVLSLYKRNNIKDLIAKELNIAEALYEKEILNPYYFEYNFLFRKALCNYYSINDRSLLNKSSDDEIDSFFKQTLYNLLIYGLIFKAVSVDSSTGNKEELFFELIELIREIDKPTNNAIEILYNVFLMLKTNDEKYFFEVREMMKKNKDRLNHTSLNWIYQPLESFLIRKIRSGETKFFQPQFELYNECFETGFFDFDYGYAQAKLVMAVEPAIRVKEFDWIERLINRYRTLGPEEIREDYYNLNLSKVLHAKGRNEEALALLNKINPEIFQLKTVLKNMLLKLYYELGYYELAKSQIDAYRHYIARETGFSSDYRDSVNNFLRIYNKLIDLKIQPDVLKYDDIEYDILNSMNIVLRDWLMEKLNELKKGVN